MSYKDNIAAVFGIKQLQSILEIKPEYVANIKENIFHGLTQVSTTSDETINIDDVQIDLSEDSNDAETESKDESITSTQKSQGYKNQVAPIEFTGFISSCAHGSGRSSTDRQFYYVNSRPCEPTKVTKLINEIYKQYNSHQYPFVFLNVNMERTTVDVNVTPDKRKIFLTKEKIVLDVLKSSLLKLFESIPRTLKVENNKECSKITNNNTKADTELPNMNSFINKFRKSTNSGPGTELKNNKETKYAELKRKSTTMLDFISAKVKKRLSDEINNDDFSDQEIKHDEIEIAEDNISIPESYADQELYDDSVSKDHDRSTAEDDSIEVKTNCSNEKESPKVDKKDVLFLGFTDKVPDTQIRNLSDVIIEKSHTITCKVQTPNSKANVTTNERPAKKAKTVTDYEDIGKYNRRTVNLKTSLEHVRMLTDIYNNQITKTAPERVKFKSAINPVFNKKCEDELSREISKDSFKQMSVVGQFNLGFIITKLEDDLFIIDQHATDEIYNFETLQKTTELTSQKLVMLVLV